MNRSSFVAKIVDLTLPIENGMPFYPGDPKPEVTQYKWIARDGVNIKVLHIGTHSGTHIDAPAHFIDGANTIDKLDVLAVSGKAVTLKAKVENGVVKSLEGLSKKAEILLVYTGANRRWGSNWSPSDIVTLSLEVCRAICSLGFKAVGIDSPSVGNSAIHKEIFNSGALIIENISDELRNLVNKVFEFHCYPILIKDGDGAPARAFAIL